MTVIDCVTMTGADDTIKPEDLIRFSREFPFVEWAILASKKATIDGGGRLRYPSPRWISDLQALAETTGELPRLALHINGEWVKDLLLGKLTVPSELLHMFARVQLNFHAERRQCDPPAFRKAVQAMAGKQIICQLDGASGNAHLEALQEEGPIDTAGLFDVSGGAGVLPEAWPRPIYLDVFPGEHGEGVESYSYHGYAGGLGPHNLREQLPLIINAASPRTAADPPCPRIWIDMETHIRSYDDRQFDLKKVHEALLIAVESGFLRK